VLVDRKLDVLVARGLRRAAEAVAAFGRLLRRLQIGQRQIELERLALLRRVAVVVCQE
jgi:hypothetical protein